MTRSQLLFIDLCIAGIMLLCVVGVVLELVSFPFVAVWGMANGEST
jgi:hypothetical protein